MHDSLLWLIYLNLPMTAREPTTVSASVVSQMFVYKLTNSFVFCLLSSITESREISGMTAAKPI